VAEDGRQEMSAQKAKENAVEKKTLLALATRAKIPVDITKGLTLPPLRKIIQRKKDLGVVTVILWRLLPQDVTRYLMGWVILDEGLQERLDGREYRAYKTLIACRKVDQEFSERSVHPRLREAARLSVVELDAQIALAKK